MFRYHTFFQTLLFCSISFFFSCHAEQEYLQTKDINIIMQQILEQHLDKREITTSILRNSFKVYIDQFDPERMYLLQKEVEPFLNISDERLNEFLAQYKQGKYKEYTDLNTTIQQAIERARKIRTALEGNQTQELFQQSMDSHADGYEEWRDPDLKKLFVKNERDLAQRIKQELITFIAAQKKRYGEAYVQNRQPQTLSIFQRELQQHESSYLFVNEKNQPMSPGEKQNDFVMHILKALASSLDAHTMVMNPLEAQDMRLRLEKEVLGIGIGLRQGSDGSFYVSQLVEGGPAAVSGQIKINDRLVEVDKKPVQGKELTAVMEMIRGQKGTPVSLLLKRSDQSDGNSVERSIPLQLTRAEVTVNEDRVDSWYEKYGNGLIGVLKLDTFYQGENGITSENDLRNAIKKLDKDGNLRGLILDLRENSGGFLSQSVKVVGLFISNGVVVISKYFNGEEHFYRDVDGKRAFNGPLIILTSKATASAAEIVAQALQDYGVALIVGDKHTYGKGTIQSQTVTQEGNAAYFKVTVGTYYTVSGKTPQIQGVKADIIVPSPFLHENIGEEYLDYAIKPDIIPAAYNDTLNDIAPNLKSWYLHYYIPTLQPKKTFWQNNLSKLQKNSSDRMNHNAKYQQFLKEGTTPQEVESFAKEDLQMREALNIMKDMIALQPQTQ